MAPSGPGGHGAQRGWPKLAGQYEQYLLNEMRNFQDGYRPHYYMKACSDLLTRQAMHDLALYYACQGDRPGVENTARCHR